MTGVDVGIIGGGLSGLSSAVDLALKGAKVALIEQSPKLGGRSYSYTEPVTGDEVDNGQHVLLGAYHSLLRYLDMIGTRGLLGTEKALKLEFHHPERGRGKFQIPNLPGPIRLAAGMLGFRLLSFKDRLKLLDVGRALERWDEGLQKSLSCQSVEDWLSRAGQSEDARRSFWHPIAVSVMNDMPDVACALLFASALRKAFLGSQKESALLIPTVGQSRLYVEGAERLLSSHGAVIITGSEAAGVELQGSKVVGIRLKGGEVLETGSVISAVPYFALSKIVPPSFMGEPPFSSLDKFSSSPIISIHLWFDRNFMDADYLGLIGKQLQWIFNRRSILNQAGKGTGCISAVISGAREAVDHPKEMLVSTAVRELNEVFPEARHANLLHWVVIKEKRATFSPTCEAELHRPKPATCIGNFYLAGDWTDTGLPATIEGAVMSGFRASGMIGS